MIDGTDVWVPIDARNIKGSEYEILDNKVYDDPDPNELFEFFPGDIVELESKTFKDGNKGQVATRLIIKGNWPDRKFNKFKYMATLGKLTIDLNTAEMYIEEIERLKKEFNEDQFFYPAMIETLNKLVNLLKNNKNRYTT